MLVCSNELKLDRSCYEEIIDKKIKKKTSSMMTKAILLSLIDSKSAFFLLFYLVLPFKFQQITEIPFWKYKSPLLTIASSFNDDKFQFKRLFSSKNWTKCVIVQSMKRTNEVYRTCWTGKLKRLKIKSIIIKNWKWVNQFDKYFC